MNQVFGRNFRIPIGDWASWIPLSTPLAPIVTLSLSRTGASRCNSNGGDRQRTFVVRRVHHTLQSCWRHQLHERPFSCCPYATGVQMCTLHEQ